MNRSVHLRKEKIVIYTNRTVVISFFGDMMLKI